MKHICFQNDKLHESGIVTPIRLLACLSEDLETKVLR